MKRLLLVALAFWLGLQFQNHRAASSDAATPSVRVAHTDGPPLRRGGSAEALRSAHAALDAPDSRVGRAVSRLLGRDVPDDRPLRGRVQAYHLDARGNVRGLILRDGTQVEVPAHQREALERLVRPGDEVRVVGLREGRLVRAQAIENVRTRDRLDAAPPRRERGRSASDAPRGRRGQDAAEQARVDGRVERVLVDGRGELTGLLLRDGTQVVLSERDARRLGLEPREGARVRLEGTVVETPHGRLVRVGGEGRAAERSARGRVERESPRDRREPPRRRGG